MENAEKMPELSIIVPIYKVEKYLDECIQSILGQTFTDFELILVDDGSPDACPQMCDAIAEQDSRVRVIHQKNGGLSAARNTGIEAARGNWLGFVDSDDFVAPDFYEKLYHAAVNAGADCAMCSVQLIHEDGSRMDTPQYWKAYGGGYTGEDILNDLKTGWRTAYIVAFNKLYKRQIFQEMRYPVGRLHEDNFVVAQLYDTAGTLACIEDELYYYRQRWGSIVNSKRTTRSLDMVWGYAACFDYFYRSDRTDLLPTTEREAFKWLTNIYYQLSPEERRSPEVKLAKREQRRLVKILREKGCLNLKTLVRTMVFQFLPGVFYVRRCLKK